MGSTERTPRLHIAPVADRVGDRKTAWKYPLYALERQAFLHRTNASVSNRFSIQMYRGDRPRKLPPRKKQTREGKEQSYMYAHLPSLRRPFLPARERVTLPAGGVGRSSSSTFSCVASAAAAAARRRSWALVAEGHGGAGSLLLLLVAVLVSPAHGRSNRAALPLRPAGYSHRPARSGRGGMVAAGGWVELSCWHLGREKMNRQNQKSKAWKRKSGPAWRLVRILRRETRRIRILGNFRMMMTPVSVWKKTWDQGFGWQCWSRSNLAGQKLVGCSHRYQFPALHLQFEIHLHDRWCIPSPATLPDWHLRHHGQRA